MAGGNEMPAGLMDEVAAARDALEKKMGKVLGAGCRPAARVGAFGCAVLDAGDDGHRPQPRAQRRLGAGPRAADAERALRVRLLPPLRADVRQDRARRSRRPVRRALHDLVEEKGLSDRHRAQRRRPRRASSTTFKAIVRGEAGVDFPDDPHRAAALRDRSGVQVVERQARARTTAAWRGSPTTSAPRSTCRRWCSATRATTPAPASRSRATRRPGESKPYGDFLKNAQGEDVVAGIRITEPLDDDEQRVPRAAQRAARCDEAAREPLPRHVRHRVHDRAGSPVHAADARRQAHGRGRVAHGRRDGRARA